MCLWMSLLLCMGLTTACLPSAPSFTLPWTTLSDAEQAMNGQLSCS